MKIAHGRSLFWGAGILTLLGGCAWSQPASIRRMGGDWQLLPSAPLRSRWKQSGFSPMIVGDFTAEVRKTYKFSAHQAPWAVLGDFNGDGKQDLVVDGRAGKRFLRLAFLSPSYTQRVVDQGEWVPRKHWAYIEYVGPGPQSMPIADQKPINLTNDSFCEVYPGKAAILRYWKAGKFQDYYLAD